MSSKFRGLYLVTVFHMSPQSQFEVFHMNSSFFLQAHDVIENERVNVPCVFAECESIVLYRRIRSYLKNFISSEINMQIFKQQK